MFNLSSNFQGKLEKKRKKEWRLFRAEDFQSLMYPCFILCRFLGIFPYEVNAPTFKVSKPYYVLSIVAICVCNIYTLEKLYMMIWCRICIIEEYNMIKYPAIVMNSCFLVFSNFIIIATFVLNSSRIRLLQAILKISSRLSSESYKKLSKLIHAKDIISFCLIVPIWIPYVGYINSLNVTYITLVLFEINMMYMNCVCILKACFEEINDNLANMRKRIANNESHVSRLIYHKQKNLFLIMELKVLQKQHLMISGTVQMLNMTFCMQLLATIIVTFTGTTFNLYFYILGWRHFKSMSIPGAVSYHVFFLSHIIYFIIKIGLIVWACETGKNQAEKINTSIHDVFNSTNDKQIKNELQLFSLQILHCNNIFSAKSLNMDAKFLAQITGSIAMHVIIMFQFVNMSHSCEKNTANGMTEVN